MENLITLASARDLNLIYRNKIENLELVERELGVKIITRDNWLKIEAKDEFSLKNATDFFNILNLAKSQNFKVSQSDFESILKKAKDGELDELKEVFENPVKLVLKKRIVAAKNLSQRDYLKKIDENDIVFGIGPAGTGKTYLAVAHALNDLINGKVEKIILTRPAVEAGEALGFLPGDLQEKLLPYLRPLYDAMFDMMGLEDTTKLIEKQIVEIAPLAYMRGRTLSKAFIILDEAQNATKEQMMMFLTRLGEDSKMIITGDITQIDLPRNKTSGLKDALKILKGIKGIEIFTFSKTDVVRHRLVSKIIEAYEAAQRDNTQEK